MKSIIRLFKAVPVAVVRHDHTITFEAGNKETILYGFILSQSIFERNPPGDVRKIINVCKEIFGLSGEMANSSFHKSWQKVQDASREQLVLEQIIHYLSTYGKMFPNGEIYIPPESLKVPEMQQGVNLVVIKGMTWDEIKKELLNFLISGIAIGEQTKVDILDVAQEVELSSQEVELVANKEVKLALYDVYGYVPENEVEFLRYILYRSTGRTLLIKDRETIQAIKESPNTSIDRLMDKYSDKALAKIFYRFKPIFLAFRTNRHLKQRINRIRRLAKQFHQPVYSDYIANFTSYVRKGQSCERKLKEELKKVNVFRKIRLANALNYRSLGLNDIVYRIRNGKSWVDKTPTNGRWYSEELYANYRDIVIEFIADDLNLEDRKIYVPEDIEYALPSSERQFSGEFPLGTSVKIEQDLVAGIYWEGRTDLDLSSMDVAGSKIGWNSAYRNIDRTIMFSGDMTDAPNGASELFYIRHNVGDPLMLINNVYASQDEAPEFKIFVGKERVGILNENYMVGPNNIYLSVNSQMTQRQRVLGIIVPDTDGLRFYLCEMNLGNLRVSGGSQITRNMINYLAGFYSNPIRLIDVLKMAGAEMVGCEEDSEISLAPGKIGKHTIINLLTNNY